jgi:hypothetical protein
MDTTTRHTHTERSCHNRRNASSLSMCSLLHHHQHHTISQVDSIATIRKHQSNDRHTTTLTASTKTKGNQHHTHTQTHTHTHTHWRCIRSIRGNRICGHIDQVIGCRANEDLRPNQNASSRSCSRNTIRRWRRFASSHSYLLRQHQTNQRSRFPSNCRCVGIVFT